MHRSAVCAVLFAALAAQEPPPEIFKIGPDVTSPKVILREEPKYSAQALDAKVQGTVLLEIVIDPRGHPTNITVIAPLGFGLDEQAVAAVERWRFEPGIKDGKPVHVAATVEVNFRLLGRPFDQKEERRRVKYNLAIRDMRHNEPAVRQAAVRTMEELAGEKLAPAMHVLGKLLAAGEGVARDPDRARDLFTRAAKLNHGPAMYELGLLMVRSKENPNVVEKGRETLERAASLGSVPAQYFLGSAYDIGNAELGYQKDAERSERLFRMCAYAGLVQCQLRLGKLLLARPATPDREYIQTIAWLDLAAVQKDPEAAGLIAQERPKLTAEQVKRVDGLKRILGRLR